MTSYRMNTNNNEDGENINMQNMENLNGNLGNIALPYIQYTHRHSICIDPDRIEKVANSNMTKNNKIIKNIENFNLNNEFWKNKYTPLGYLPKLAEYKKRLDKLIYQKFENPENILARKKIFLNRNLKASVFNDSEIIIPETIDLPNNFKQILYHDTKKSFSPLKRIVDASSNITNVTNQPNLFKHQEFQKDNHYYNFKKNFYTNYTEAIAQQKNTTKSNVIKKELAKKN